jgi:hypothetical protein
MSTTVVNLKTDDYDVFIGRPSIWGNRFKITPNRPRLNAIRLYARELCWEDARLETRLDNLRGKRLGCYCAPLACHGHILAALADGRIERDMLLELSRDAERFGLWWASTIAVEAIP